MGGLYRAGMVIVPLIVSSLWAGPKIEFDTKTFNCGDIVDGKADKINAVFNVKNTGNVPLKLENVRPGCGCTVVKYDTMILPGKTAKIEAAVNISNYHSGVISKYITVTSNAENDSNVRLTIEATVMAVVEVSETNLTFDGSDTTKSKTVVLTSKKADLKVTDVVFRPFKKPDTPEWRADLTMSLKRTWTATDSTRANGYRVFKLVLYPYLVDNTITGETVITTNHPDKKEIIIQTTLTK
jgi:hypothetical protein